MKLRVKHYPQVPCKPYTVEVNSLEQAVLICTTLANYDLFQLDNNIKLDYANMTIVQQWDEEEQDWADWHDEESGIDNIFEYMEAKASLHL